MSSVDEFERDGGRLALAAACAPGPVTLGAAALTVVALYSRVDHVAHSAAVPLTLAVLGAATAHPPHQRGRGSQGSRHPRP